MSDTVPLTVKWGKEVIDFDFVVAGGVKGLKSELEERTRVPADRMKLMAKSKGLWKGVLKDDIDLSAIDFVAARSKIKGAPLQLLLMGSAAELTGPKTKTVFLEDLPPEEVAKVQEPSGLQNLGNTCYLNSVVQCIRAVPQLRRGLEAYSLPAPGPDSMQMGMSATSAAHQLFLAALRDTYQTLDRTSQPVAPATLVRATKMAFPQFAHTGPQGVPLQQDAEEFYSGLLTIASAEMKDRHMMQAALPFADSADLGSDLNNVIDALFGFKVEITLTCDEFSDASKDKSGDASMEIDAGGEGAAATAAVEPPVITYDTHRKLVCNIQGGSDGSASSANVSHIMEGIKLALNGSIEKHSDVLGRDAMWTSAQRIARLPPVLVVQFGRFYWKPTPDSMDHAGVKCKVMKPVAFNGTLDVYEFCTENIRKVLKRARDKALAAEEDRLNKKIQGQIEESKNRAEGEDAKEPAADNMETDEAKGEEKEELDPDLQAALAMSMQDDGEQDRIVGPGLPADFQGQYELFAVVTHKGRDADGGHYMAWVKASNNHGEVQKIADTNEDNEDWFVFDDDEVSPCKTEDVLKLKGGGDWHMSYLNFYRAKK